MSDLIRREDALKAIENHQVKDTMGFTDFERKAVFEWTKYDIYKIIHDLPSVTQPNDSNALDSISRQEAIKAIDEIESEVADGYGFQYEKWRQYFCDLPSADIDLSGYSDRLWRKAYEQGKADAEPRWIPCDKGEPGEDMECWITVKTTDALYRGNFTKRYGERRDKGFITSGGFMWWNTAIAWMPIYEPEPWKGGAE